MSNNEIMPRTGRISQKCGENSPSFCAEGGIPGFEVGSGWGFRKSEMDKWVGEQEGEDKTDGN